MIANRKLRRFLDQLYEDYVADYRKSPQDFFTRKKDPLLFPHRYRNFHDREAAAFIASVFAYGNVTSLCSFIDGLLGEMGPAPAKFLMQGEPAIERLRKKGMYYRLHKTDDILALLYMLSAVYNEEGSLYNIFLKHYCRHLPSDRLRLQNHNTISIVVMDFVKDLYRLSGRPLSFLVPSPADGSPCKRLNLFLRWMVRRDEIDLGLWKKVSPSHLIMPLDTHIGRVATSLGWIQNPSLSWKKAERITEVLRQFDPEDPTRYDFSLCHESMAQSPWIAGIDKNTRPHRK